MFPAMKRIARTLHTWRSISSPKALTSSSSSSPLHSLQLRHRLQLYQRILDLQAESKLSGGQLPQIEDFGLSYVFPAVIVGLLGAGTLETSYADAEEAQAKTPVPSESPLSHTEVEESAKRARKQLEELLKSKGMRHNSYPRFTVAAKGQKVTIKFQVPPTCDMAHLIANLASHLGTKVEERGGGSDIKLRAWDSAVAWQLTLRRRPEVPQDGQGNLGHSRDTNADERELCILIFRSLISFDKAEIEFIKQGSFSSEELDALVEVLQIAGGKLGNRILERKPGEGTVRTPSLDKSIASLQAMGVMVFGLDDPHMSPSNGEISWDTIAGYEQQKREIEDTILLALHKPEVYDDIARGTRRKFETNRPRAVLFEGPPGTGKTSCARVIAKEAGVPLLYVPLEVVMSKYYGESERLLGKVFSLANDLPNGAIIFLDEVDSFAVARDNEMHEATRRILSVLLRQIDGFEQEKKVVVIAATNRKQDLDPALISRFDSMIPFGLPDQDNRQEIAAQYAKHLNKSELIEFAKATEDMSGRDIRDVCQQAERRWASKVIRGQVQKDAEQSSLPSLQEYIACATERRRALLGVAAELPRVGSGKRQLDLL